MFWKYVCKLAILCAMVCTIYILLLKYPDEARPSGKYLRPSSIDRKSFLADRKPSELTFVYSDDELVKTILDIRRKNCRLESSAAGISCQQLDACNNARARPPPSLPMCERRLPGCIMIGVAKAGTLEVINFLMMHPGIVVERFPKYEISFFSDKWERGIGWYQEEMPFSMPEQITMEKSPRYFSDPETPGRIWNSIPDVKLVLIVRDPVDRTISQATFHHSKTKTTEFLDIFANGSTETRFFRFSIYDEPMQRYLEYFDRSQIHVIDSDRFKRHPYDVIYDVETYLELPHVVRKKDFVFNNGTGFYCLRSVRDAQAAVCFGKHRGREGAGENYDQYRPKLRRMLRPHNERFFELIGRKFDWQ